MVAPNKMALVSRVAFDGKLTLKVSLSVSASVKNPIHCLDIKPTSIPDSTSTIFGKEQNEFKVIKYTRAISFNYVLYLKRDFTTTTNWTTWSRNVIYFFIIFIPYF